MFLPYVGIKVEKTLFFPPNPYLKRKKKKSKMYHSFLLNGQIGRRKKIYAHCTFTISVIFHFC